MEGSLSSNRSGSSAAHDEQANLAQFNHVMLCNICLVPPTDPVSTSCGHLFCSPCLYQWFQEAQPKTCNYLFCWPCQWFHGAQPKACPTCRTALRGDTSNTPTYGSQNQTGNSGDGSADPHEGTASDIANIIPPRSTPLLASGLESSGPFVSRIVALETILALEEERENERLQILVEIYKEREAIEALREEKESLRTLVEIRRGRLNAIMERKFSRAASVERGHA